MRGFLRLAPPVRGSTLTVNTSASRDLWWLGSYCIQVASVAASSAKHSSRVTPQAHVRVALIYVHTNTRRHTYIHSGTVVQKKGREDACGRAPSVILPNWRMSSLWFDLFGYDW